MYITLPCHQWEWPYFYHWRQNVEDVAECRPDEPQGYISEADKFNSKTSKTTEARRIQTDPLNLITMVTADSSDCSRKVLPPLPRPFCFVSTFVVFKYSPFDWPSELQYFSFRNLDHAMDQSEYGNTSFSWKRKQRSVPRWFQAIPAVSRSKFLKNWLSM